MFLGKGGYLCQSVIVITLSFNFIKITLRHGFSPVNLRHIFGRPFPKNSSEELLLAILNTPLVLMTFFRGIGQKGKTVDIIAQKMKFPIKNFFSKCDQIRRKLRIWSYLLKKSLIENFILYAKRRKRILTHLMPLICFYTLRHHQKTPDFFMFSGGLGKD